jgi:mono/diheme cytochrome c family protein
VTSSFQESENETLSASQLAKSKERFKEECSSCHSGDGHGQTVIGQVLNLPDFIEEKWGKSDIEADELAAIVRRGKGEMPAFGKKLTRQEIFSKMNSRAINEKSVRFPALNRIYLR